MSHTFVVALLCAAVLVVTVAAQRKAQRSKGPRAVALVEWLGAGPPRVIPVAIMVDGRFYDASIYKASPVPMALDPGTVYEVEESGQSAGFATLTTVKQTAQGAWFADARYLSKEQLAAQRAPRKPEKPAASEPEGPPKLRRGTAGAQAAPAPAPPATPAPSPGPRGPDEPPVLRKPAGEPQTPTTESGRTAPSQPAPAASAPAREDTDHPVLRRGGRASAEQAESLPGTVVIPAAGAKHPGTPAAATSASAKAAAPRRVLAAISDAGGPEPHSYLFGWTPQERLRLTNAVEALAAAALADYARAHPGATPGKLEDVQVRAFDVDYNNSPDLVLMAHAAQAAPASPARRPVAGKAGATQAPAAPAGLTYWVTLVVREDFNGDLHKLMGSVTDSKHLDAFPRMELIDAVDVDGDGRGELLFRQVYDNGPDYVIYRVTPDTLTELFNTAG